MATYAYKDDMRKDIIYAASAVKEDRNKKFYCPNPNCTAHLYICAVDGSKKAYFRATKKEFPHVPMCPFGSSTDEFQADQFDETTFVFDNAMDNLCIVTAAQKAQKTPGNHNQGTVKKHPPRTLRQIYLMCKSKPVTETYGNKEIGSMILDDRSEYRYPKGCFGNRIIESFPKKSYMIIPKNKCICHRLSIVPNIYLFCNLQMKFYIELFVMRYIIIVIRLLLLRVSGKHQEFIIVLLQKLLVKSRLLLLNNIKI